MSLKAGMNSPRDWLAKLEMEHARLKEKVSAGDLTNFAITGYHMLEWIRKSSAAGPAAKTDLDSMYNNTDIRVCRDITNESKHFELKKDYKDRVTDKTSAISGFGAGRFGKGDFGVGEPSIVVVILGGARFDSLTWAERVVDAWKTFFAKHRL